jgi:hypothetical protein
MKKIGGILAATVLLLFGFVNNNVFAATCNNVSTYGSVQLAIPVLPRAGEYAIWLRVQAEVPNNELLVQVNQNSCLSFISNEARLNEWFWLTSVDGGSLRTHTFSSTMNNSLEVIGITSGVKLDKIILTEPTCQPLDFGENCQSVVRVEPTDDVTKLTPIAASLSGAQRLSDTPITLGSNGNLKELRYVVDGKVVQRSSSPVDFDTTRISNGKHTVIIEAEMQNKTVVRESIIINVKNTENFLTPFTRWLKINNKEVILPTLIIGIMALIVTTLYLLRKIYRRKHHLKSKGF